ncbi:MAG: hypothetical protein GY749_20280 [Desulfobacteraceae bacterium]|nr:hypothetical protein [Desulfobacteraceae bacterium]
MEHFQLFPLRILVADNDQSTLSLYRKALYPEKDDYKLFPETEKLASKLGGKDNIINIFFLLFDIAVCSNKDEVFEAVKTSVEENRPFAAAFLDTRVLLKTGIQTIKRIQQLDPFMEIVIVTAYSDTSSEDIVCQTTPEDNILFLLEKLTLFEIRQLALALAGKWQEKMESLMIGTREKQRIPANEKSCEELGIKTGQEFETGDLPSLENNIPDSLPGLDIREGVCRMGGMWAMYADLVIYFCNEKKDFGLKIRDYIDKKDYEAVSIEAHAMKGSAATISASGLSNAAKKLEKTCGPGKNDKQIMDVLRQVEEEFAIVVQSSEKIALLCQADSDSSQDDLCRDVSQTRLCQLFQELDKSLRESDPVESERCVMEIKAIISSVSADSELSGLISELARMINDFNFEIAGQVLKKLVKKTDTIRFSAQKPS